MKFTFRMRMAGTALIAVLVIPVAMNAQEQEQQDSEHHPHYRVRDLGVLPGGTFSQATAITNDALVGGLATNANGPEHAVLWYKGSITDIGTPGLGGPNSAVFGVNERRQATGLAEAPVKDPNGEDFCGYGTFLVCQPFVWQSGVMTPLPTLGGKNGEAGQINNRGDIAGNVENTILDLTCPSGVPQLFEEKPVIWEQGRVRGLDTFPGDPDGWAFGINGRGQVVGASGECAPLNPQTGVYILSRHALLWDKRRTVHLPTLGGTGAFGPGNIANQINNRGQVAGVSDLAGDKTYHGFLWAENTGVLDLKTLPGDFASAALGINDRSEVVGVSLDAQFNPRAFLWLDGQMMDLNQLAADSPLYLLIAHSVDSRGEIIGFGVDDIGDVHAFSAIPCGRGDADEQDYMNDGERDITASPKLMPDNIRKLIQQRLGRGWHIRASQ